MKILLTGHEGFIGKNIKHTLSDIGLTKVFLIEKPEVREYLEDNCRKLNLGVELCDYILHVGAISDTSNQDYHDMLYYNYHFTKCLVDIAKRQGKKIIFSSSASIYGCGGVDDVPNNIYAWSKSLAEEYGRTTYPDGFTSLRYFNVYGPHEEHKGEMASIAYQAWEHMPRIDAHGLFHLFPKKPQRDFIHVSDVVWANMAAMATPASIYDVGTGEARTFEDMLNLLEIPYEYHHESKIPEWYQYFTQADKNNWVPDWKPRYTLETGCEEYLKYLMHEQESIGRGGIL